MKGFGTVVTGTLVAGTIRREEELEVFPAGKRVRVRGVQVHGSAAEAAIAGQRTALNLAGVSTEDLARGTTLAPTNTFRSTSQIDARLSLLKSAKPLKDGARVHFHAFTKETIAEVRLYGTKQLKSAGEIFARLKLAESMLLLPGDRFIIRQFSPVITIGGGIVLDAAPPARKRRAEETATFLTTMLEGAPEAVLRARVERRGAAGLSLSDVSREMNITSEAADKLAARAGVVRCGAVIVSSTAFAETGVRVIHALKVFHDANPLVAGMGKEELRERVNLNAEVFAAVLAKAVAEKKLVVAGELIHLPGRGVVMKDEEAESKKTIEQAFQSAGLKVPLLKEVLAGLKVEKRGHRKSCTLLFRDKVLIKISDDLVFHHSTLARPSPENHCAQKTRLQKST